MGGWPSKQAAPARPPSPWPALPPELADLVLRRLLSLADRVRFTSVCRHWRHAAAEYSQPPPLPWLLELRDGDRPLPLLRSLPDGELHSFACLEDHTRFHCFGSFGSWIRFAEGPNRQSTMTNLLTGATVQLPGLCNTNGRHLGSHFFAWKVIVCSPDLIAAIVRYYGVEDEVMCWRPGMPPAWGSGLCSISRHQYQDMAFYDGRIYTINNCGDLFLHVVDDDDDVHNHAAGPRVRRLEKVIQVNNPSDTLSDYAYLNKLPEESYLLISCTGKLLRVQWIVPEDCYSLGSSGKVFRVFEADFDKSQWLEVESLGDQVLFVSPNCSRAIRPSDHGSYLQGSTIYFLCDGTLKSSDRSRITCGVYNMRTKTSCPIPMDQLHVSGVLKGAWFFP